MFLPSKMKAGLLMTSYSNKENNKERESGVSDLIKYGVKVKDTSEKLA